MANSVAARSRNDNARHVALVVETSNAYGRGLLLGVRRYLAERPGWSIYLAEHGRRETDLSWLDSWQGQGVLARIENQETAEYVQRLDVPVVDLSAARLLPDLPAVETDDNVIAQWAVEHFTARGLRHFAFCGDPRYAWSNNRGACFAEHVQALGFSYDEFRVERSGTPADDRLAMADWLRRLPKPVGVLACYDIAGQQLLEACKIAELTVPDSVAVLGVDNDELICNMTSPPLSSIQSDPIGTGFLAASLLDEAMAGRAVSPEMRLVAPLRVVTRQSSDLVYVSDPLVGHALQLIRNHADDGISVVAIQRAVGLSRRSLDYRFTKILGRTVHEEITRVRMERLADLLLETDWTLAKLSERLGFSHSEYMGVAFKRFSGRTPGEYRRINQAQ